MRWFVPTLMLALTAAAASAQTYVPGQTQQRLNQEQIDLQSQRLQQLQRQTNQGLEQPDPVVRMQAAQAQLQINRQAAELNAARMQAPTADPTDLNARLQASGAAIRRIDPPAPGL
jgi:TolA-binding protein